MLLTEDLTEALSQEAGVACVLDAAGVMVHCNKTWDVALPPGAPGSVRAREVTGHRWLDFITGELAPFYAQLLAQVMALPPSTPAGLVHVSECNTPALVRRCTARFVPLFREGERVAVGATVVYGLLAVGPAADVFGMSSRAPESYRGDAGFVTQCGCCRRLRDPREERWDFLTEAVSTSLPRVSHGLCATCLALYYPP